MKNVELVNEVVGNFTSVLDYVSKKYGYTDSDEMTKTADFQSKEVVFLEAIDIMNDFIYNH